MPPRKAPSSRHGKAASASKPGSVPASQAPKVNPPTTTSIAASQNAQDGANGARGRTTSSSRGGARKRKDSPDRSKQGPSKRTRPATKDTKLPAAGPSKLKGSKQRLAAEQPPPPERSVNQAPVQVLDVLVFGSGECGELGLGPRIKSALRPRLNNYLDASDSTKFQVVQVSCGGMHTVALTADSKVVTWGVNDNGALGRDTEWEGGLRDVEADSDDEDDEELNPHESTPTEICRDNVPAGTRFVQVAAGDSCSFALTEDGLVFGWGTFRNAEGKNSFVYDATGKLLEKQEKPARILGVENITQITCGANHALALDAKGCIWAWGAGEQNQLGRRLLGRRVRESYRPQLVEVCRKRARYIGAGEYHSFAIDQRDNVWAWGLNSFGEAGYAEGAGGDSALLPYPMKVPDLCGRGVEVLAGGAHHSAAVTSDGSCLVWGRIDGGQLGINFTEEQLSDEALVRRDERDKPRICLRPTEVPNIGKAVYVACGTDHTIFVNDKGQAFSSGFGSVGQLGLGAEDDVDVAQLIKGKDLKERSLTWAGAGGQYSVVAGPAQANGI